MQRPVTTPRNQSVIGEKTNGQKTNGEETSAGEGVAALLGDQREDDSGAGVYLAACSACHGLDGGGRIGPALAGNFNLVRSDYLLALILTGGDGMPAFHDRLSESEIVAVANHVRTSWGNDLGQLESELLETQWWLGAEDTAELYRRVCARCHGTEGGGKIGPPLAGNDHLADEQYVAGKILHGQGGMPAFEGILAQGSISALASYVRSSFGNEFGNVELQLVRSLSTTQPGTLEVSLVPGHSRLSVMGPDGYRLFVSDAVHETVPALEPGAYTVTASTTGFEPASGVAWVRSGEVSNLLLRLEPRAHHLEPDGRAPAGRTLIAAPPHQLASVQDESGRNWYLSSCALCHGPAGQGGVGPPLAGNDKLQDQRFLIHTILNGSGRMPSFANRLTDGPIAAIASFERTSLNSDLVGGNQETLSEEQVAEQRRTSGESAGLRSSPSSGEGDQIYQANCAVCHGSAGAGGAAPALSDNRNLADLPYVVSRIVMGGGGMPPFNRALSSSDIAEVASFIRSRWGNDYRPVEVLEAQNYHGGQSSRSP